jgi:hypothetical protein
MAGNLTAQDSLLLQHLKKNTYPLQFEKGKFSGPGYELLTDAGQTHSFFLIGEEHGLAENPKATAALFKSFKDYGYRYFATETGPYTARFLQQAAATDVYAELQQLFEQYPWSIPFYVWKEECAILEAVVNGASTEEALIWGLDQEFAASFRMHFDYLEKQGGTDAARQLAAQYLKQAVEGSEKAFASKQPGQSFMAMAQPSDFEKLRTAFTGQSDLISLLHELEESIEIYQLWFTRQAYLSNQLRAKMMKRHFQDYYAKAREKDKQPKVMFKFGANHLCKGASFLNIYDLGNFITELAEMEGVSSFHLFTLGIEGTQCAYTPFSESAEDKQKAYEGASPTAQKDYAALVKVAAVDSWSVIDLRPLRTAIFDHTLKGIHPSLEKLIWSYDAVLVMPEVTASTPF